MQTMKKKVLSTLLAVMIVVSLFAAIPLTASAAEPGPSNLTVYQHIYGLTVSWTNTVISGDDIKIYLESKDDSGTWTSTGPYNSAITAAALVDAEYGQTYTYRARYYFVVTDSYSDYSNESTVTYVQGLFYSPTITGPTSMTITEFYNASQISEIFTITGNPEPTVTITGTPNAYWDDSEKRLYIQPGLAVGTYPIEIKASNPVYPDAIYNFTVTVSPAPPPTITGPTSMTITEFYNASQISDMFTITGDPEPTVTISGDSHVYWNNSVKRLYIQPGLAVGTYPIVITVSSGVEPDATHTFTVTVVPAYGDDGDERLTYISFTYEYIAVEPSYYVTIPASISLKYDEVVYADFSVTMQNLDGKQIEIFYIDTQDGYLRLVNHSVESQYTAYIYYSFETELLGFINSRAIAPGEPLFVFSDSGTERVPFSLNSAENRNSQIQPNVPYTGHIIFGITLV
jgi:hypothetical protein